MKSIINHEKIINPDTPEAAYLLGFLWADGYMASYKNGTSFLKSLVLEGVRSDIEPLYNSVFKKFGNWLIYYRKRFGRRESITIQTFSHELTNWCEINGFMKKSYRLAAPVLNIIPEDLKPYWFRGYFDGDGCFYFNKKNRARQCVLAGHFDQDLNFFADLLKNLDIKYSFIHNEHLNKISGNINRYSAIRFTGRKNTKAFGDYIYQDNVSLGLTRKYNKFVEMIE